MKLKSLRAKLSLFGVILVFTTFLFFSIVFFFAERARLNQEILNTGLIYSEFSAQAIYADYLNLYSNPTEGQFEKFKIALMEKLAKNPDVVNVYMVGINGRILFNSSELETGKYTGPDRFIENEDTLKFIQAHKVSNRDVAFEGISGSEIFIPISETSGTHIVTMVYTISYDSIRFRLTEVALTTSTALIPTIIVSIALILIFSGSITRPVTELTNLIKEISKGKLNKFIDIRSSDEIGELTNTFNQMTADLQKSRSELEQHNKTLEAEVAKRTEELQKQNNELERMNKIMVGRETEMIELKEELRRLKNPNS